MITVTGKYSNANIMIDDVEESCMSQIQYFVNHLAFTNPIIIMPDTHAGKGSVIGFTMKMTQKVIPNVVGVDIGCFVAETKIRLTDNREIDFKQLIEEDKKGKENYCFSKDNDGNIVITKIIKPRKTRTVTELAEVTLDNDEVIYCTTDHIYYTLSGEEEIAKNLTSGQSLFPLYIYKANDVPEEKLSIKDKRNKLSDYLVVYNPNTGLYDYLHYLADEYNRLHNVYNKKGIRHHKDFDKYNNNPINIEIAQWKDHYKIHAAHASESNKKGISGWAASWRKNKEKFSKMSSDKMKKLQKNEKYMENRNKAAARNFSEYCQTDKFKKQSEKAGKRGRKFLTRYSRTKKGRINSSIVGASMTDRIYECPECGQQIKSARSCPKHFNKKDHKKYNLTMKDMILVNNHKVKNIKIIKCKPTDVYCLTTEKYGNFALASGVFVHNCGMQSINIGKNLVTTLEELDYKIRTRVPFGQDTHEKEQLKMKSDFPWLKVNILAEKFARVYNETFGIRILPPKYDMDWFMVKCQDMGMDTRRAINSIGTLGGGNHFIETGISQNNDYWITVHTGSRNFGKRVCDLWQGKAKKILTKDKKDELQQRIADAREKYKYEPRKIKETIATARAELDLSEGINMKHCEWLEGENSTNYLFDMIFAQVYADVNREYIIRLIENILELERTDQVITVHNFIDFKDFIIRKGAIRSYEDERMIIPFNMRDGILLCEGKSNEEWNCSAPHGAGRVMSRSQAKRKLLLDDFQQQMTDVYSTSVELGTLDEAPDAYKDAQMIEDAIGPTAKIIDRIKPIHNMKDSREFKRRKKH